MKIPGYSVLISALFLSFVSMSDLAAQKIGAVTVQETQQAVDAVLYETTPQLNEYFGCRRGDNCSTDGYYCRVHNKIRSRRQHSCDSCDRDTSCRRRSCYTRNSRSSFRTSRCNSRKTTSSCNSRRTTSSCSSRRTTSNCNSNRTYSCGR